MRYAARLNSFLSEGKSLDETVGLLAQGGITDVDLNYPEHADRAPGALKTLLRDHALAVNSIAMRYRKPFVGGEFTNSDPAIRRDAIDLTKRGVDIAGELGAESVTVWLGFDGYDYTFQKDYVRALDDVVSAFQEIADHNPSMKISIEYKPYEERVFAFLPNFGVTMHVLDLIDRPSMGMTLDFCHQLMAGELPSFCASLALARGRLFGIHLNDGNNRSDDGLMVGSVHPYETAELLYYLDKYAYAGVIYFDTFPVRESAVEELAMNVQSADLLLAKVRAIGIEQIAAVVADADGIASQRLRLMLLGGSA